MSELGCSCYDDVEATYKCETQTDVFAKYPVHYGKKYCELLARVSNLSPQGTQWRDATLNCLQTSLAEYLKRNPNASCGPVTDFAFESHVSSYTAPLDVSFCDLSIADKLVVANTVKDEFKEMLVRWITGESVGFGRTWKQVRDVAHDCYGPTADRLLPPDDFFN